MARFLRPDRGRAGHRQGPGDDRLVEVVGHRGRPQARPGPRRSSTRSRSRRARTSSCARRGSRAATARPSIVMAFDEQGQADTVERKVAIAKRAFDLLTDAGGLRSDRRDHRPEHLRHRHGHRGARRLRRRLHRGDAADQGASCPACWSAAACPTSRSRSAATTPCARRSTPCSCTTRSARAWTWASSTPGALPVYDDIDPELRERAEDLVLNRRADATERMLEIADEVRGGERGWQRRRRDMAWRERRSTSGSRTR